MKRKISIFLLISILTNLLIISNVFASGAVTGTWHGGVGSGFNPIVYQYNGTYTYENGILTFYGEGSVSALNETVSFKDEVTNIVLDEGITGLTMSTGDYSSLKNLHLPSTFSQTSFEFTGNVEKYVVSKQNNIICSIDGVIYDKDITELVAYPYKKTDKKFVVPETVKTINIDYQKYIEEIVLPDGIKSVTVFSENLKKMNIPDTTEELWVTQYENLNSCIYENGLYYLGNNNNPYFFLVGMDKDIKKVNISKKSVGIGAYAFSELTELKEVTIPDNIKYLSGITFFHCEKIETIVLGSGIKDIGDWFLYGTFPQLKNITVSNDFRTIGRGAIFPSGAFVDGHSTECPYWNEVEELEDSHMYYLQTADNKYHALWLHEGSNGFEGETLNLPKSLVTIATPNDFGYFPNIKTANIPRSLKYIAYGAFSNSDKLTDVYYEGSKSEWEKLEICQNNEPLLKANIHFQKENFSDIKFENNFYTYDGTEKSLTVSGDLPDGAKVTYTNNNQINAGTYKVTAKVTCEEYNDLTLSATLTIEKAPISVKANDIQVVKGASAPSLTYTITSGKLFGSDTLTGSLSTKATTSKTGNYDITQGTLKASSNYNLSFTKGTLSVVDKTPQNITVSTISDKTYGDSAFKLDIAPDIGSKLNDFTFVSSNTNVAEISTDGTVTIKAAGETDITVKQAGNDEYAPFENTQKLVVNKKTVTVKEINLNDKTALLEGVLEADSDNVSLNFDTIMLDIINTDEENKITVNADNFVLSGEKALNYEVAGEKIETTVSPDNIVKIDVISKNGSVFGAANYLKGSIVTLEAHSNSGYRFGGWYIDDKSVSSSEKYTFNADTDITIEAKFAKKSSGGGGSNSKNSGSVTKPSNNTPQAETTEETTPFVKETSKKIVLKVGSKNTKVDDKDVINDVAPIIRNDRTMLPARFVSENLGAKVAWNEDEKKVTITRENTVIEIFIGWTKAYINGKETQLDSPAFIENERTYTPVRFIAEALSAQVDWNEASNQVTITK